MGGGSGRRHDRRARESAHTGAMRYPDGFLDDIRARLSVSQVVSRKVALKKAGREWKGLSPFKTERTPSFFVNDHKGFYHCFASGEHGDIFSFVMKTEGLTFPEAVERLAGEAGVPMPERGAPSPERTRQADARQRLYELLETSARFFEEQLRGPAGAEARRYVTEKRGLRRETISSFRLGFAPAGRTVLKEHLGALGYSEAEMISSGMLIGGEDIPISYDRFRNRVMFPIADTKGRTIAFGGRALSADAPAKYLNSPETPLFHKGAVLFNAHRARPLAHDASQIIVVEGYMDVVALTEGGFGQSVAPLGTALTEDQIKLLWRVVPEPVLCFDGDGAGRKAAFRAVETALPHLKPGNSVTFAFLPDGLDPDDMIRQQGADAMRDVLSRAQPLVDVLWEREWSSGQWNTPERRAKLQGQLYGLLSKIGDPTVREHYQRTIRAKLDEVWGGGRAATAVGATSRSSEASQRYGRPPWSAGAGRSRAGSSGYSRSAGGGRSFGAAFAPVPAASESLKRSPLVAGRTAAIPYREALLLRTLVNHPWLIEAEAEAISEITFTTAVLARLRDALLSLQAAEKTLDSTELRSQLARLSLAKVVDLVERAVTHKCDKFAEPQTGKVEVETGWRHTLALHDRYCSLHAALAVAERTWHEEESESALARIHEIKQLIASSDAADALPDE
jgi:DNA primase